ncbi:MAG: hypothetical protein KGL39_11860 [Patescibacteria group bacterium]|nr:hypothetical protein [Patescibacteria group bacterium]
MNSDYAKTRMWQIGTGKIHRSPTCRYVKHWLREGMREVFHFADAVPAEHRCQGCWR